VAELGGGAVDAAIAAMLVAMVNEPGMVSLGGGAFATVLPPGAGSEPVTVDGYVAMPGLGRRAGAGVPSVIDAYNSYGGGISLTVGPGSVATPGALAAFDEAHRRFGQVPWREVVAPALASAREGFVLGQAAGYYLPFVRDSVLAWDPETAATLRRADGAWVQVGEHMAITGLADTLAVIAEEGARTMYEGQLAQALAADMEERGGLVTGEDLARYEAVLRPALAFSSGEWSLHTNPPPAIGGVVLAAMLTLLGDRPRGEWTADDVASLVDVQRRVLDYRRTNIDQTDDRDKALGELLRDVGIVGERSSSTAHVSVVDSAGGACAITASSGYGSGQTVPGTGLWLNNCLGERELNRGAPPEPGARLASNMAPTVGRSRRGAVLAIGSPGADRITTALTQVLAAFSHGGATLQDAIDRPRLHVHYPMDDAAVPVRVEAEEDMPVPELDLPVFHHHRLSMYFGGVAAAQLDDAGQIIVAGDPRRAGVVAVSPGSR
jgi:gamma-glutamyltranspeptidase/glutathione hydrolase